MAVTVYRWDDPGAPVLSNPSAGSLIGVLDACLVDGYTGKTGAGWTKAFSGTNFAAYRQGAGSMCYLRVDDRTGSFKVKMRGYESMTDIDTGVNAFPTTAQLANGVHAAIGIATTPAKKPWIVVADNKRFYLWVGVSLTTTDDISASTTWQALFFFGDIISFRPGDTYCCQIMGSDSASNGTERFGLAGALTSVNAGSFIVRDAAQAEGSVNNSKYYDYYGGNSSATIGSATCVAYPDPITGGINLSRIHVSNGATVKGIRGRLPGVFAPLNALPGENGDTFSGVGDLDGRTFILLDCGSSTIRCRVALETSDTWD